MGKLFGVVLAIIAIVSAYPIVAHWYVQPVDISTHGHAIDEQLADTMAEAGLSFLAAQLLPGARYIGGAMSWRTGRGYTEWRTCVLITT